MLTIHYFAGIREQVGSDSQELVLPEGVATVADLIHFLEQSNTGFARVTAASNKILVAVNQEVVGRSYGLSANDEVAFFPPMTGG